MASPNPPGDNITVRRVDSLDSTPQVEENITVRRVKFVDNSSSTTTPGTSEDTGPELGIGERLIGGALRGFQEDPVQNFLFDKMMDQFPGAAQETVESLVKRTSESSLADASAFATEYLPSLAAGGALYSIGRRVVVKGLARLGAKEAAKAGGKKAAATTLGRVAQRQAGILGVEGLVKRPLVERAAQIAGGGAGFGVFEGAREAVRGGDLNSIGREALTAAVLSVGLEGTASAAFGLIRRARNIDPTKLKDLAISSGAMKVLADAESAQVTSLGKMSVKLQATLGTARQHAELLKAFDNPAVAHLAGVGGAQEAREGAKSALKGTLDEIKNLRQARLRLTSDLNGTKMMIADPTVIYSRGLPYNPGGMALTMAEFRLKISQTPESLKGQLGRTGARFLQLWDEAENLTTIARSVNQFHLSKMQKAAGKAMGFSRKQTHEGRNFLPVVNAWETIGGGEAGVRAFMDASGRGRYADEMVNILQSLDNHMNTKYAELAQLGAEPAQTSADLLKRGVQKFWPHVLDDIAEGKILERLMKGTENGRKVTLKRATEMMEAGQREGLRKFGSIDYQRHIKGSLLEKVTHEMPFNANPFDAAFRYLNAVEMRINYGKRFGFSGEIKNTILESAVAEGASLPIMNTLLELGLGHQVFDQGQRQFSQIVTGIQTGAKLTLAVWPNLSQSVNTLLFAGFRNTSLGLYQALKGETRDQILQGVALAESVITGMGRAFGESHLAGSGIASLADKFAAGTLKWTGFSTVEKWNRVLAGATGHQMLRDTLAKAVEGKLRGSTLDIARRRMESLGVNLDEVVKSIEHGGNAYLKSPAFKEIETLAMFKMSATTQFNPNTLRRPIAWNHPLGRIASQFKTFSLGQGRFIRDQVFAEAARGNMKPLAYFASIYPVAGEIIGDGKALIRGKEREQEGLYRLWSNYMMIGGLGLMTDTFTSMRFGKGPEFLLGPAAGDIFQYTTHALNGNFEGIVKQTLRLPVVTAATALYALSDLTVESLSEYLGIVSEEESNTNTTIDLGTLRTLNKVNMSED